MFRLFAMFCLVLKIIIVLLPFATLENFGQEYFNITQVLPNILENPGSMEDLQSPYLSSSKRSNDYVQPSICSKKYNYVSGVPKFQRAIDLSLSQFKYFAIEAKCAYKNETLSSKLECDQSFGESTFINSKIAPIVLGPMEEDLKPDNSGWFSKAIHYGLYHNHTMGYVALNNDTQRITISFHGTKYLENWITNIDAYVAEYNGLQVHHGFLMAAKRSHEAIAKILQSWIKESVISDLHNYDFVYTGHSLGGALATMSSVIMMLDDSLHNIRACGLNRNFHNQIKVVSFASPRVFQKHAARNFELRHDNHARFADPLDLVPHVPPEALGFAHTECCWRHMMMKVSPKSLKRMILHVHKQDFLLKALRKRGQSTWKAIKRQYEKIKDVRQFIKFIVAVGIQTMSALWNGINRLIKVVENHAITRYLSNVPNTKAFFPKWSLSAGSNATCSAKSLALSISAMLGIGAGDGSPDLVNFEYPRIDCVDSGETHVDCSYVSDSTLAPIKLLRYRREPDVTQCKSRETWRSPDLPSELHQCLNSIISSHNRYVFRVDGNLLDFTSHTSQCYQPVIVSGSCGFSLETKLNDVVDLIKTTNLDNAIWQFYKAPLEETPENCRKYVYRADMPFLLDEDKDAKSIATRLKATHNINLARLLRHDLDNGHFKTSIPDKISVDRVAAKYKLQGKLYNRDVYQFYDKRHYENNDLVNPEYRRNGIPVIEELPSEEFASCLTDPAIPWWDCSDPETKHDSKYCPDHCSTAGADRFCHFVKSCHLKNNGTARFLSVFYNAGNANLTIFKKLESTYSFNPSDAFIFYDISINDETMIESFVPKLYLSLVFKNTFSTQLLPQYEDPFGGRRANVSAIDQWFDYNERDRLIGPATIVYPIIVEESVKDGLRQLDRIMDIVFQHYRNEFDMEDEKDHFAKQEVIKASEYLIAWRNLTLSNATSFQLPFEVLNSIDDKEAVEMAFITSFSTAIPDYMMDFMKRLDDPKYHMPTFQKLRSMMSSTEESFEVNLNYFMALLAPIMYNSIRSLAIHMYVMKHGDSGIGENVKTLTKLMDVECKIKPLFLEPLENDNLNNAITTTANTVVTCVEDRLGLGPFREGFDLRNMLNQSSSQFIEFYKDMEDLFKATYGEHRRKIKFRMLLTVYNLRDKLIGEGIFDLKAWFTVCNDMSYHRLVNLHRLFLRMLDAEAVLARLDRDVDYAKEVLRNLDCSISEVQMKNLSYSERTRVARECIIRLQESNYYRNGQLNAVVLGIEQLKDILVESQVPVILLDDIKNGKIIISTEDVECWIKEGFSQKTLKTIAKKMNQSIAELDLTSYNRTLTKEMMDRVIFGRSRIKLLMTIFKNVALRTIDTFKDRVTRDRLSMTNEWHRMFQTLSDNVHFNFKSVFQLPQYLTNLGLMRYFEFGNFIKLTLKDARISLYVDHDIGVQILIRSPPSSWERVASFLNRNGVLIGKGVLTLFAVSLGIAVAALPAAGVPVALATTQTVVTACKMTVTGADLAARLIVGQSIQMDYLGYSNKQNKVQGQMYAELRKINDFFNNPKSFNFESHWMGLKPGSLNILIKQRCNELETLGNVLGAPGVKKILAKVKQQGPKTFFQKMTKGFAKRKTRVVEGTGVAAVAADDDIVEGALDITESNFDRYDKYHQFLIDPQEWKEFMIETSKKVKDVPVLEEIWENVVEDIVQFALDFHESAFNFYHLIEAAEVLV